MLKRIVISILLLFTLVTGAVYAAAEAMASPDTAPGIATSPSLETVGTLYEALRDRRWAVVAGIAVVLVVWGLRKVPLKNIGFFQTKIGGWLLAFSLASALEFGAALSAGQPPTFALLITTLGLNWTASGGWNDLKDVSAWMKKKQVS